MDLLKRKSKKVEKEAKKSETVRNQILFYIQNNTFDPSAEESGNSYTADMISLEFLERQTENKWDLIDLSKLFNSLYSILRKFLMIFF
jgi:hypothetical protein